MKYRTPLTGTVLSTGRRFLAVLAGLMLTGFPQGEGVQAAPAPEIKKVVTIEGITEYRLTTACASCCSRIPRRRRSPSI